MSIKLSNIYHTYSKGTPFERLALADVSVAIDKGEIVAIIGHTGSGKSTLVQHLNGLLKPDKGTATIDEIDITAKGAQAKNARQQVGMVFQYPEHQIFAETVFEDIAFGPRNKGFNEEEVAKAVPIERILLETDSPYLAPEPNRGKRNSSLNIPYIARELAAIKGMTYEEIVAQTSANAKALFGILS